MFWGTAPLRIWEGKNRPNFGAIFAQLHISIANICGTVEDIDKPKKALSPALAPTWTKKIW